MVKKNIEYLIKMKSIIDTITESIVTEGLKDISYKQKEEFEYKANIEISETLKQ